eukprot:CAMPEP_0174273608 /NCGR_PEP_ID=MMETSP0439-20130205/55147_1 /TAXON_ID=0 /ORGANISM="Stereomyxa ramosa, Strain Chinc5" /LENGTH=445 /DNA_ID=CAMNT_0015364877 /DNA_START=50 /DNA_END=1387 /DNA_ORIENTATION=-
MKPRLRSERTKNSKAQRTKQPTKEMVRKNNRTHRAQSAKREAKSTDQPRSRAVHNRQEPRQKDTHRTQKKNPQKLRSKGQAEVERRQKIRRQRQKLEEQRRTKRQQQQQQKQRETKRWTLMDFEIGAKLGEGQYGCVYRAQEKKTMKDVALKVLPLRMIEECGIHHQLSREIQIQSHLCHENVLRLYGYFYDKISIFLVLEYAPGGELYKHIKASKKLTEKAASGYILDVVNGLSYCHSKHVIHRDIKPENLLIGENGKLKVADFGWSVIQKNSRRSTLCGTLDYLAPEMSEKRCYDKQIDVWGVGVLLYEMLVGDPPFEHEDVAETHRRIVDGDYRIPMFVSKEAKDLIQRLLVYKAADRIKFEEIKTHPFITKYQNENQRTEIEAGEEEEEEGSGSQKLTALDGVEDAEIGTQPELKEASLLEGNEHNLPVQELEKTKPEDQM